MRSDRMQSPPPRGTFQTPTPTSLRLVVCLCALSVVAAAGAEPASPRLETVELPAELARVLTDYETAWQAGDAEALTQLFVEDGFVSGKSGWQRGHEAIRAKYADAGGDLRLRGIEYATDGNTGFIVGGYGYGEEAATKDRGFFVLVLARLDGNSPWRIVADLDRSAN